MIEHLLTPLISQRFLDEERYRNGHLRVINALDDVRILGVHIPELKKLAKELSRRTDAANSTVRNSVYSILSVSQ